MFCTPRWSAHRLVIILGVQIVVAVILIFLFAILAETWGAGGKKCGHTAWTEGRNSQRVKCVSETSPMSQEVLHIHVNHNDCQINCPE